MVLYPLLFEPVLKEYIWGGRNLEKRLGRSLPADVNIAESWEIAAHEDGTTLVSNGALRGRSLSDLLVELGVELIGERSRWALEREKFPLLIKLLDANHRLSVQVHPDDAFALAHEGNELGKTEMWVVLHADPGAQVILGVKAGTTREAFRQALFAGRVEPFLHHISVQTGDHINVSAGSLHAILGGLLLVEIQQNSNTTYRVYDWGRIGRDGRARPLHVDKALQVINFDQVEPRAPKSEPLVQSGPSRRWLLNRTPYFSVERVEMDAGATFDGSCDGQSFEIWGVMTGSAEVRTRAEPVNLTAVRFTLLPAALGQFTIGAEQAATLLRVYVDD